MLKGVRRRLASGAHGAAAALDGVTRQDDVVSLGLASRGGRQVRGNGTLALTADALHFFMWVPSDSTVIQLADITAVDTVRVHAGKTIGGQLLRVAWRSASGEDAIAWRVPDLDGWLAALTTE